MYTSYVNIFSNFRLVALSLCALHNFNSIQLWIIHSFSFFKVVQWYFVFRMASCVVRWQPLNIIIIFPSVSLTFAPCFKMCLANIIASCSSDDASTSCANQAKMIINFACDTLFSVQHVQHIKMFNVQNEIYKFLWLNSKSFHFDCTTNRQTDDVNEATAFCSRQTCYYSIYVQFMKDSWPQMNVDFYGFSLLWTLISINNFECRIVAQVVINEHWEWMTSITFRFGLFLIGIESCHWLSIIHKNGILI